MVSLRGHHLVCLHFFNGEGLGEDFRVNYHRLLDHLAGGRALVVAGKDDVCRECPHWRGEACGWDDAGIRELDRQALAGLATAAGNVLSWTELAGRVRSLPPAWWSEFCAGCDWDRFCARPGGVGNTQREKE